MCHSRCSLAVLLCDVQRMKMSLALKSRFVLSPQLLFLYLGARSSVKFAHIFYGIQPVTVFTP